MNLGKRTGLGRPFAVFLLFAFCFDDEVVSMTKQTDVIHVPRLSCASPIVSQSLDHFSFPYVQSKG